jgi:hypothetical protein
VHRWHVHIPIAEIIYKIGNAIVTAAQWVADQACKALKVIANGVLELAKQFLNGVLLLNAAAFAIMKGLVAGVLMIDYVKLEAGLSTNILESYISAAVKFTIGGTQFGFDCTINLSNLLSVVVDVFNKAVDFFKRLFPVEEATAMLQRENYSKDAVASLLQPVSIRQLRLIQHKLGHLNKGGAHNLPTSIDAPAMSPEDIAIDKAFNAALALESEDQDEIDDSANFTRPQSWLRPESTSTEIDNADLEPEFKAFDPQISNENAQVLKEHEQELSIKLDVVEAEIEKAKVEMAQAMHNATEAYIEHLLQLQDDALKHAAQGKKFVQSKPTARAKPTR